MVVPTKGSRAHYRQVRLIALVVLLCLAAAFIFGTSIYWRRQAAEQVWQEAAETLAVQTEILSGVLDKYRMVPPLLSRQSDIIALFPDPGENPISPRRAREKAEEIAGLSGAKEVIFLLPDMTLLAAARNIYNGRAPGAEPLTEAASHGILGRQAVSLDSPDRAYAFASDVRRNGKFVGVVIAYIGFEGIEATWSLTTAPVFITDEDNVIILTNQQQWRHRSMTEVLTNALVQKKYVNLERNLPLLGWQLHVLADQAPARRTGITAGGVAALLSVLAGAAVLLYLSRRERLERQTRRDKAQALRLERIVRDRTRALSLTNDELSHEVEERKQAEEKLTQAQAELIQTAKLAVLGQMAATLSHEMNQPLAAMRTYADNATRFLDLSRVGDARAALGRISAMVDRMAELSGALLSFSRRPGTEKRPVSLGSVLEEALILVRPRAKKAGVSLKVAEGVGNLALLGGRVRLSQIVVNLVNNAVDALRDTSNPEVVIGAHREEDQIVLTISDNGPGIPNELHERIFEPFFTTKPHGEGVGVGLSIVYNIVQDFGGSIRLVDREGPGCTFEIRLQAAEQAAVAAAN
ncbi:ATP-binding protein [Rhizobium sp. L1K21]|uniref:sensor histidine kinase n=1 Tax=Rhizobium sp. L1K21 TaxID=2954933 RepID=UPI002092ECE8|nr:ATP-binding protein [Rhizobium sp. L1K21]MCO6184734.1 ATP-binding protein [Rhizobium sp. L1K21]